MDEKQSSAKGMAMGVLKSFGKRVMVVALVVFLIVFLIPLLYVIFKDDFDEISEKNSTYYASVNSQGQVTYVKTEEDGTTTEVTSEEMAEDFESVLGDYIDGSDEEYKEKINYLIGAETVTKLPYIESSDSSLVGQVKFYRFSSEAESSNAYETASAGNEKLKESYRLTYVEPATFETQLANYQSKGNTEVFKHFTMDDDGNVVIAYWRKDERKITTGDTKNGYLADLDLTLDVVKEKSAEDSYSGDYKKGFSMVKYTAYKETIDYLSLVEQYVMPSNLLYAFLIQTRDIALVEQIAKLAYENEIAIGIYDNQTILEYNDTYTYNKVLNVEATTKINSTKIETTNPKIDDLTSKDSPYTNIVKECKTTTVDGKTSHVTYYCSPSGSSTNESETYDMYIVGTDANNKVTSLGTEKTYNINFNKKIDATSSPTTGVILADTWIAKWKATYQIETKNENTENTINSTDENAIENVEIAKYNSTDELLNAFDATMKQDIVSKLDTHATSLKDETIKNIMENTDFTVATEPITADQVDANEIKIKLNEHIKSCSDCTLQINAWWLKKNNGQMNVLPFSEIEITDRSAKLASLTVDIARIITPSLIPSVSSPTIDQIYTEVTAFNGELKGTIVETEYKNILQAEMDRINKERAKQKKEEIKKQFKKELKSEDGVKYIYNLTGNKQDVNIGFTEKFSKTSSQYKKTETVETTKIGEKFSEVINDKKFYESKQAIINRAGWLWEYIRENEDTAKLEDILRYLLNIATNSTSFGIFTDEDIADLFKAFGPKEVMKSASSLGANILRDYIRSWENQAVLDYINGKSEYSEYVSRYISEDKTVYYIRDDGKGHPTVGFGVDIFNGGFVEDFVEQGYSEAQLKDISGAVQVPVEFVDSLEEREISECMASIKQRTAGLDLENYQIYALVSRAYNCGVSGAINGYSDMDFIEAYKTYFNPETDIKYGEKLGDFENSLYTEFMDTPIKSDGEVLSGLIRRRESEWTLFQTGYMDRLDRWASSNAIIDCAEEIHRYMEENEYTYCVYFNNDYEECSNSSECGLNTTFEKSKTGYHHTCCATYVSWVLQEAGYLTEAEHTDGAHAMKNLLLAKGWQQIESIEEAEPGDVLYYSSSHVEIYAGDGNIYNAGSGNAIRNAAPYEGSRINSATMILRAP